MSAPSGTLVDEPSRAAGPDHPPDVVPAEQRSRPTDRCEGVLSDLAASGLAFARLNRDTGTRHATILLSSDDLDALRRITRRHGFVAARTSQPIVRFVRTGGDEETVLEVRTELLYGKRRLCLGTGEKTRHLLHRASEQGHGRLAEADELIDLVLHGVLDRGAFSDPLRRGIGDLVDRLRATPTVGGSAAERVQRELSPTLGWSDLLAALVHRRWDEILATGPALRRRLLARAPIRSLLRFFGSPARPPRAVDEPPVATRTDETATAERTDDGPPDTQDGSDAVSRKQIRGSGLLLSGRGLSVGLKFLAELLIVRYLATESYGAWTYALSAVISLRVVATFGLNRAIARFVPVHIEKGERAEFIGVVAFVLGGLLLAGAGVVAAFYALPEVVAGLAGAGPGQQIDLLFIVIFLVPLQMLDDFLTGICAAFSKSRTIFVRRYLLSPFLRIGVALGLILAGADVRMLAYGYLTAALVGMAYYAWSVYREMRSRDLLGAGVLADLDITLPVRRVLSYTVPVMAADWFGIMMTTTAPLLLGYFTEMSAVALFQVVVPLVTLNKVVAQSFGVLYEPSASRLIARDDDKGLGEHYWSSAVWVAVLSFPAFAMTFTAAAPLTALFFGERYLAAAPILSLLAVGAFADCAVGFNSATLRVAGRLRWLVGVNAIAALVNLGLNLLLIPRHGALGAAVATGSAWVLHVALKQAALWLATGVKPLDLQHAGPYAAIALAAVGLVGVRLAFPAELLYLVPPVAIAIALVLVAARRSLSIEDTFPELLRIPALGRILGAGA